MDAGLEDWFGGWRVFARGVLEGEEVGVVARMDEGEGECAVDGDSGRLKGDARGEPNPRGEGFFGDVLEDWLMALVDAAVAVSYRRTNHI